MATRIKNIDPKSALHFYELSYNFSAGSDTISNNVGSVPYPCKLKEVIVCNTASAIAHVIAIRVNNAAYQTVSVGAISASGACLVQPGAVSPALISAGSYVECRTSATAGTAPFMTKLRFYLDEHKGK